MNFCWELFFADAELSYVWDEATWAGKGIIIFLFFFSLVAWTVMVTKAKQIHQAKKLNGDFEVEFRGQEKVMDVYRREIHVEGCPLFTVYQEGCQELEQRLKRSDNPDVGDDISLKSMEHIKRTLERSVSQQTLRLESGLVLLAIAVSGAPFIGLLGTVWGVMSAFANVGLEGNAQLATLAPGVASALSTTIAGLFVAIPSMFGYNWLVHNLRLFTVELDNFAQELVSKMETEYLKDD